MLFLFWGLLLPLAASSHDLPPMKISRTEDAAAIAHHKEQAHYLAWGAFKESGGTLSSVSKKASGKFMT